MQTKLQSFTESVFTVAIGFVVAWVVQLVVFPLYGIHIDHSTHLEIVLIFTVVSIIRSYFVRRLFNRRQRAPTHA